MSTAVDSMQRFWSFWCLTRAHRGKREKKRKPMNFECGMESYAILFVVEKSRERMKK